MADLRISELPVLSSADLEDADDLAVADYSASETRRVTAKNLVQRGVSALIDDGSIPGGKLVADSVTAAEIAPDAITASELADDSVDSGAIGAGQVSGDAGTKKHIAAGTIDTADLADDAIDADKLADNAVDTAAIADSAVTDAKVADGIDGTKISDGTITSAEMGVDSVGASQVQANSIGGSGASKNHITAASIGTTELVDDAVTAAKLADDAVDTDAIADGAVVDAKVASGIDGAKLQNDSVTATQLAADSVTASELANDAVDTDAILDGAVTNDKVASGIDGTKLSADSVTATQIAADAITASELADNAVDTAAIADGAVTGAKLGAVTDRGLDQTGDLIGHTNSITAGDFAGINFDAQGHITSVATSGEIPATALPEAESGTIGAVKPGSGLTVQADGTLDHSNSITGTDIGGLSFDDQGHCIGFPAGTPPVFERDAIPIAGDDSTEVGGVFVPADADVGVTVNQTTGELTHESSPVAAGTYASVTVDDNGHVTAGTAQISGAQLPDEIPANDIGISDGTLPVVDNTPDVGVTAQGYTQAIANSSISRRHFSNTSTAYIQETQPTSSSSPTDATVFRGCLWLKESTGQLYMYNGNAWHIVAGGRISAENLRFCGTINASTGLVTSLTDEGVAEQKADGSTAFSVGAVLPAADDAISACYFMADTAGSNINVNQVVGESFAIQDLCLAISNTTGWVKVSGSGGGGGSGSSLWTRSGSAPNAQLTPDNTADNLVLSNSDWLALPRNTASTSPGGGEGSLRWHEVNNDLEVYTGTEWVRVTTASGLQFETIDAADNANWGSNIIRPKNAATDFALQTNRRLVFEGGTKVDTNDSGDLTSSLTTAAVSAKRTWTLPDETGVLVTKVSSISSSDSLSIDCGTY